MRFVNSFTFRSKLVFVWSIWAIVCIFIAQSATAAEQTGRIVGWGRNDWGQCNIPSPNADFIAVAAGINHSLGLKKVRLYHLAGDLNDDCKVDFYDFAKMAAKWLADFSDLQEMAANWLIDCDTDPNNPACVPE